MDENRNSPEDAANRNNPKKQETNVQTKDVEEAIKTCDGIVGEEGGCV